MNYHKVAFERSFGTLAQLPPSDLPELVFAGRSNVGKSSLINKIFNQKQLARVSGVPGKTITINFFRAEHARFVDLPGYGYARRARSEQERWSRMIEGYFGGDRDIQLVISLMDLRHPPTADDIQMVNYLIDRELPFVVVLTKLDKLKRSQVPGQVKIIRQALGMGKDGRIIPFSAETKQGRDEIWRLIEVEAGLAAGDDQEQGADGR